MLWTKGAHQSGNFQTFDHSHENLTKFLKLFFIPRVTFPLNFASSFSVMTQSSFEIFWLEHYMRLTENVHQCTIFQTFLMPFLKPQGQGLTRALKNLKSFYFNGLLLTKVYSVSAKKVQRSYV